MRHTNKPVRKCHACPLNFGDRCWLFEEPRAQWQGHRACSASGHAGILEAFHEWQKHQPAVKTRRELRKGIFRPRVRRNVGPVMTGKEAAAILRLLKVPTPGGDNR